MSAVEGRAAYHRAAVFKPLICNEALRKHACRQRRSGTLHDHCAAPFGAGAAAGAGSLAPDDEAALVGLVAGLPFRGIAGPDDSALRLAKRCENLGIVFEGSHAYAILELDRPARFPGAPGRARQVGDDDEVVFGAFMAAFLREAMPYEPMPTAERIATEAKSGRYLFWTVDDVPVPMAGKVRETATLAAISCATRRRSTALAATLAP
jgi:hypothetical protein